MELQINSLRVEIISASVHLFVLRRIIIDVRF